MIGAYSFVKAFERNCPHVGLTANERSELGRLFFVAQEHWTQKGARDAAAAREANSSADDTTKGGG